MVAAIPTAPGGGTRALIGTGDREGTDGLFLLLPLLQRKVPDVRGATMGGDCGDENNADVESWCDVSRQAGEVGDEAYEILCREEGVYSMEESQADLRIRSLFASGVEVVIEDALRITVSSNVYDATVATLPNEQEHQWEDCAL